MRTPVFKANLALAATLLTPAAALAGDATPASNATALDILWVLVAAVLVFFMQAGFAMVEAGFTRAKNACNIVMKNLMDLSVGAIMFFLVGFGLMFGTSAGGFIGSDNFMLSSFTQDKADTPYQLAYFLFQAMFAATAATIASGTMAERTKFSSYMLYSVVLTALIYPVVGHWAWNGDGWLASLGFMDFAGSTVVHSVGAWAGLVGCWMLGPRHGKYLKTRDGKYISRAIPGHNIPMGALGVFILFFGWFGFNAGSTVSGTDATIPAIAVTTLLSGAAGAVATMVVTWIKFKKPDTSMTLNGALAGLVGITAGCNAVSPTSAILIGLLCGVIVVFAVQFFDQKLRIDDPVGAIAVHGVCGAFGTLSVGLFAEAAYSGGASGLLFGGGASLLITQAIGVAAVFGWTVATSLVLFGTIKATVGLRVTEEEEARGLDIEEHGMEAYHGFQVFTNQ
ncbi:MAG: ammonium transporter [Bradymonadia bacterium]